MGACGSVRLLGLCFVFDILCVVVDCKDHYQPERHRVTPVKLYCKFLQRKPVSKSNKANMFFEITNVQYYENI